MSNVAAALLVGGFTLVAALAGVSIPLWRDHRARKAQAEADLARQRAEWSHQRRTRRDDVIRERLLALIEAYYAQDNPQSRRTVTGPATTRGAPVRNEQRELVIRRVYELMVVAPPALTETLTTAMHSYPFPLRSVLEAAQAVLHDE